jgi:hypothetical protein
MKAQTVPDNRGLVPAIHAFECVCASIGIGESLAALPLPHHRTYGSVYGGSVEFRRHVWARGLRGEARWRRRLWIEQCGARGFC